MRSACRRVRRAPPRGLSPCGRQPAGSALNCTASKNLVVTDAMPLPLGDDEFPDECGYQLSSIEIHPQCPYPDTSSHFEASTKNDDAARRARGTRQCAAPWPRRARSARCRTLPPSHAHTQPTSPRKVCLRHGCLLRALDRWPLRWEDDSSRRARAAAAGCRVGLLTYAE